MLAAYVAVSVGILAAIASSMVHRQAPVSPPTAGKPMLLLLTSLPLVFNEQMSLEGGGSAALARLEQSYKVEPINVADAASLKGRRLLLMAQSRAQPAEALVALDRWVRGGGHLLLLADPKLEWPSERPLGDKLRPPPMFADTGLLKHWGLALSNAGLASSGGCEVADQGLVARCRIGKGSATVIADADFINVEDPAAPGLDLISNELGRLGTR